MERYVLTDLALLEDHFPGHLAYGRWDWVVGCWLAQTRNGPLRALVPTWPLLNPDGTAEVARPRLGVGELNESMPEAATGTAIAIPAHSTAGFRRLGPAAVAKCPPKLSPAAAASLNQFVALIPGDVRSLIAGCGPFQWLLLEAVHTVSGFAAFARVSVDTKRIGFCFAAWCLARAHAMTTGTRRELNRAIMAAPRRQLLERLAGEPFSAAALSAIYKLDPLQLNAALVRRILAIVADPGLRCRLAAARRLSPALLEHIGTVPDPLLHTGVMAALAEIDEADCPFNVVAELNAIFKSGQADDRAAAVEAFKRVRDAERLVETIARLKDRLAARKPFPAPPLRRSQSLRPLLTVNELTRESRQMQSCVRTYGPAVQARHSYVCAWLGRERATVELVKGPRNRWTLGAFAGRNNRPLSIDTVVEIATDVARGLSRQHLRTKRDSSK